MRETSQKRALKNYRNRLSRRGMARFEVLGHLDLDHVRAPVRELPDAGGPGPDAAEIEHGEARERRRSLGDGHAHNWHQSLRTVNSSTAT